LLCISFIVCFNTCKKYKTTTVKGRFVNIPINKGIPDETFVLKSANLYGENLPSKAQIELTTKTDKDGYFEFKFEAYVPKNEKKQASYGVEWLNLNKKKQMLQFSDRSDPVKNVDLYKFYDDDLLSFAHIENPGDFNEIIIKIVIGSPLIVSIYNENLPKSINDYINIEFINQFGKFTYGGYKGDSFRIIDPSILTDGYYPSLVPGETTIRATITKNGNIEVRDTTFFVEDKEYNLVYRY
jgi:hypothetical protein